MGAEPALPPLRERLLALQDDLLAKLESGPLDGGFLGLLGGIKAALDESGGKSEKCAGDRAVVSDDGREIRLALYRNDEKEAVGAVALDPDCALVIAGKLLAAARSHLRKGAADA